MRNEAIRRFIDPNVQASIEKNFFENKVQDSDNFSVMMMFDLDQLKSTINDLHQEFPSHFLHTFAAKANPVRVSEEKKSNKMKN